MNAFFGRCFAAAAVVSSLLACVSKPVSAPPRAPSSQEILQWVRDERFAELDERLSQLQSAYEHHLISDEDLYVTFRTFFATDADLAVKYDKWVFRFPKSYVAHLARGSYYSNSVDTQRGDDSISNTRAERLNAANSLRETAAKEFLESIELTSKPILSFVEQIYLSMGEGDLTEDRRWFDRANAIDPDSYIARSSYMAAIETRWGGTQEMMKAFLQECRATQLSEANLRRLESIVYEDEGWIHQFEDEDYAAAEVAYRKAIALGGNRPLKNFAYVLYKQGKYREALEPLAEALTKDPGDPGLHFTRALTYMKLGMVREGLADTQTAAIAGYADAQNNLGAYYTTGIPGVLQPDPRAGVEWFRKAVAQDETNRPNLEAALAAHPELSEPADAAQTSAR